VTEFHVLFIKEKITILKPKEGSAIRVEGRVYSLNYDPEKVKHCDKCNQPRLNNRREPRIFGRLLWIEDGSYKLSKTHQDLYGFTKQFSKAIEEEDPSSYGH
tara:strand:+ start:757 stop:1062 length:306 start_codon:yes stop_codon:yes gene_type:complete